jgi:hypothetical protein
MACSERQDLINRLSEARWRLTEARRRYVASVDSLGSVLRLQIRRPFSTVDAAWRAYVEAREVVSEYEQEHWGCELELHTN